MWAEKDSHVLKQAAASESVKSSSLYFEFVLTKIYRNKQIFIHEINEKLSKSKN